jgi:hypothetical protein
VLPSPDGRWGATSYRLIGPRAPIQAPLLSMNVEEPQEVIMVEKQKVIFLLDSEVHFSVLPFSPSPWSNDKVIVQGNIWPAPRVLFYLASDLLLGRPPVLSLFSHSP